MRRLSLLLALFWLVGCSPSALQTQAEIAFYEAQASIQKNQAQPIFVMVATDPMKPIILENVSKIEVFAPTDQNRNAIVQYQMKDYNEPAWRFLGTLVSVAVPWIGAYSIVNSVKDIGQGTAYNYNNNVSQGATGNFRVQGNTSASSSGAGASSATGMTDATSTPTVVNPVVVEQPAPVIVTQPEPIVVTQPAQ